MRGTQFAELSAFVAVAEHRNFTKAAVQLGISRPALSQTIHSLEDRLGVRLLNRTTRSVALSEAGEQLLTDAQPVLDRIDQAIEHVNAFRESKRRVTPECEPARRKLACRSPAATIPVRSFLT